MSDSSILATGLPFVFSDANVVIVTTPTKTDKESGWIDSEEAEKVLKLAISRNPYAHYVIKSRVDKGFINRIRKETGIKRISHYSEFVSTRAC